MTDRSKTLLSYVPFTVFPFRTSNHKCKVHFQAGSIFKICFKIVYTHLNVTKKQPYATVFSTLGPILRTSANSE